MRYLIIGLGIYGSNLARDLTDIGNEVIGADVKPNLVQSIKDYISTAYILDATDEASLQMLPLSNVDVVVVAIGENFGASIRTVALLKKAGVKTIYARAADAIHEAILEGFHVSRIVRPEQRAAHDLVLEMTLGTPLAVSLPVAPDSFVTKFPVPDFFVGLKYQDMNLQQRYGIQLIDVCRPKDATNIVGMKSLQYRHLPLTPDAIAATGDVMVLYGTKKALDALCRYVQQG